MPSLGCGFLSVSLENNSLEVLWRFSEICPSYAMAQCAKSTVKAESIIGLIYKIVGCPNCDIHLFGRQHSCNHYRESIILYIKQLTCCSCKYQHFLYDFTCCLWFSRKVCDMFVIYLML